eukprot:TRINITY_DN17251_c0_g1_i1.p1 TRINITY_DN17251_c0_g1~~TRINITY_DN17251_c0_g1_i1.p1  ORF type:complete len:102 (-),score=5.18 TRINITY_DN17251_c0_g1_i1:206-511(-)
MTRFDPYSLQGNEEGFSKLLDHGRPQKFAARRLHFYSALFLEKTWEGNGNLGGIGRSSRREDNVAIGMHTRKIPIAAITVFRRQCLGSQYHPPVGLHTAFG